MVTLQGLAEEMRRNMLGGGLQLEHPVQWQQEILDAVRHDDGDIESEVSTTLHSIASASDQTDLDREIRYIKKHGSETAKTVLSSLENELMTRDANS